MLMREVATIKQGGLRSVGLNSNAHLVSPLRYLQRLAFVLLDALDTSDFKIILLRNAYRCTRPQLATDHIYSEDEWILLSEYQTLVNLQDDWEHRLAARVLLGLLLHLIHVFGELLEEMIDDVSGHDLHTVFVCLLSCLCTDLHVKSKDHRIFRVLLVLHDRRLLDIKLVHLTDVHVKHRNLHFSQELQQSLQGAQSAGFHKDSFWLFLEVLDNAIDIFLHIVLELLKVIIRPNNVELCSGNSIL
mmetsp:Transcript_65391/g.156360  ORF Transcript_65391/g.156360 Transcript_65391/m.156360 type:complete len:245 (-) Transcript_65391:2016-2750(-)